MTKEFEKAALVSGVNPGTLEANLQRSIGPMCERVAETIEAACRLVDH